MFIFQNPVQPIKYFEYYSEKLRKEYNKPHPKMDLDFLHNMEENTCKKIMDIYKVLLTKCVLLPNVIPRFNHFVRILG